MSLKDINLKRSYDSDKDDILNNFYIPALSNSIKYMRLAGFFSSSALALVAKGIAQFLQKGGHIKLITSAKLTSKDVEAIKNAHESSKGVIRRSMIRDLENIEEKFVRDHVQALGWMVTNDLIDFRVGFVQDQEGVPLDESSISKYGMFHQKRGILKDEQGNRISFSGSDNETANSWINHVEEFKVFREWRSSELGYFETDLERFEAFWNGEGKRTRVMKVPEAVERKLIDIAPDDINDLKLDRWVKAKRGDMDKNNSIELWDIQKKARDSWLENDKRGIFEMATGTGKTYAALGCLKKLFQEKKNLITVIATPQHSLVEQWHKSIRNFGLDQETFVADSSNPGWRDKITDYLIDIDLGNRKYAIILTTHDSFCKEGFRDIMKDSEAPSFLIVDEVHGGGSSKRRQGLLEDYDYRLGLSATPERYYDTEGTNVLLSYFDKVVYNFSLENAVNKINPAKGKTYLAPYDYKIQLVELTEEELIRYKEETKKIRKSYYRSKDKEEKDEILAGLYSKRADIIKSASRKLDKFEEIIDRIDDLKHCLVYCSPQSPDQMDSVKNILEAKDIAWHQITQNEGKKASEKHGGVSERTYFLNEFGNGTYQALVSMKVLDEGIDIPQAKRAIMISSSGNPRQYIQRRGRVLRHHQGKDKAIIHDMIVIPGASSQTGNQSFIELERKILAREVDRYKEFSKVARNKVECMVKIDEIEKEYGLDLEVV